MNPDDDGRNHQAAVWRHAALSLLAVWLVLCAVSYALPGFDQAVAAAFFSPASCPAGKAGVCGSFQLAQIPWLQAARQLLQALPVAAAILVLADWLRRLWCGARLPDRLVRLEGAILLTFALGPGLLVNGILKTLWGRPRPMHTDLFGGAFPFVPAGEISSSCQSNCSFVAGEASSAFLLICLVPLAPKRWRKPAFGLALTLALVTSAGRVAFGAHYLSDAVLGGLSTLVIFALLGAWPAPLAGQADPDKRSPH